VIRRAAALVLVSGALAGACAPLRARPPGPLVPVAARDLPALADDLDEVALREAVERTLPAYERAGDAASAEAARRLLTSSPAEDLRARAPRWRAPSASCACATRCC
jgi:hypothetical protein